MRTGVWSKSPLAYRAVKLINRNRLILTYGTFGLRYSTDFLYPRSFPETECTKYAQARRTRIYTFKLKRWFSWNEVRKRIKKIFYPVKYKYVCISINFICILISRLSYSIFLYNIMYSRQYFLKADKNWNNIMLL